MDKESYGKYLIEHCSAFFAGHGYTITYIRPVGTVVFEYEDELYKKRFSIHIGKTKTEGTVRLTQIYWIVFYKELTAYIFEFIHKKAKRTEEERNEDYLMFQTATFMKDIDFMITNESDAEASIAVIKDYVIKKGLPYLKKYSKLINVYKYLQKGGFTQFMTLRPEKKFVQSLIYKILDEVRYQQFMEVVKPHDSDTFPNYDKVFEHLIAYIEEKAPHLKQLYAPELPK